MDVREKLVELFYKGVRCPGVIDNCNDCPHHSLEKPCDEFGATADMLIANGVTVQKHGRWLLDGRCSECLENPVTTHKTYCPSCGAKMDLER